MVYPLLKDKVAETQGLIAIMSQWQLKAEDLLPVIDKINKTADSYAITSQDIVDGLNRVGAAAKNAGMTIEETIGAITVLREASGRTGKEVGTALNTIFSYMTRDKTIKLMEALGIRVFEDEARTTFRSVIELMEELAARWQDASTSSQLMTSVETELLESFNEEMANAVGLQEEWNDMQQRDISQAAAGVRRRNFFISLMSRFSKIQEVVNGQLDAEGYSMRENERTMATLEKQIQSLKAAAEQFAVAIGDAGLLDQMKGLVEGTTDVIQWFNGLDGTMKTLIITFAEVTLAAKVATAMVNMMGLTGARAAGGIMRGWVVPISATTASMRVLTGTVTGLATVLKNVGTGLLGFFGGPVGLAITAVAVAAGALYNHVKKTREELAALPTTVQNMQAQFEITQKLEEEYSSLTNSVIKTAEEKQKLADVTAELGRLFPEAISNIDAEGNATELNNDILRESIKLRKEDIALKQEQLADQFADFEKSKTGKDFKKNLDKIEELEEKVKSLTSVLERYKELFGEDGVITKGEQREIDLVKKSWQDAREKLNALNQEQLKNIQTFDRQAVAALNQNEAFRQLSDTAKNKLVVSIREFNNNDLSKANAEILKLIQSDLPSHIGEMGAAFKRFGQSAKDASDLNELNADFIKFRDAVVTVGQDLNWTGDQSVQFAYALMEGINPIETAEFKMWKLEEVIRQVGDSSMTTANAAAIASNILATKVSDATMKTIAAHWDDIKAVKDRAKAYEILAQAIFLDVTKGGLAVGMAGTSDTIRQQTREMQGYLNAVAELEALTRGGGSSGGGGGGPSPGPGAAAKGAGKEIDYLAEAIQRLTDAAKQYELVNMDLESVLDAVNRRLGVSNAEYDYLNGKVEAGTATAQDYARMQELLARKIALLKNEQVQLANANQEYQRQIESLTPVLAKATAEYDRFKAAGDEEHTKDAASAVSALKSEIDSLSGAIASNTQQLWENQGALDQLATSAYTAYYQQTMAWMSHMDAIGKMNSELQSQVLAGFDVQKLTLQDLQDLEKRQFNDRLDRLKTERDRIKDAYDARMKQYEAEIEANNRLIERKEKQAEVAVDGIEEQIKVIQRLMDLLDDDAENEDREEAERQHNKKLAELAEERLYHELRTGLEHQDRIKEIDDETAEEKRRWQLQQNDWARKDQKDAYQDQINALKEKQKAIEKSSREEINQLKKQNDRKKQEMQRFYNELNSILNDSNLRMMAASQERGEEFIRKMGEIARQATQAFNDNYRPDSVIGGARDLVDDARSGYTPGSGGSSKRPSESDYTGGSGGKKLKAVAGPESYTNKNGTTYMWSQNLAGLLGYSATWNQSDGTVTIGGKKFTPAWNDNGRTFLGIREVAEALGFSTTYDNSSREVSVWDKAHIGAKVKTTGIAELMHDERVLSPNLTASFDNLAAVLSRPTAQAQIGSLGSSIEVERKLDKLIAIMERKRSMQIDKLLNIEHAGFEDRADMQALGVEVRSMLTAVGR